MDDGGGYDFSVTQGPDGDYIACDVTPRDAEFIAAARTAVPALLDLLDQAEAELDSWMTRAYEAEGKLWKAEARIKAVEDVLDRKLPPSARTLAAEVRRALESVPPPSEMNS